MFKGWKWTWKHDYQVGYTCQVGNNYQLKNFTFNLGIMLETKFSFQIDNYVSKFIFVSIHSDGLSRLILYRCYVSKFTMTNLLTNLLDRQKILFDVLIFIGAWSSSRQGTQINTVFIIDHDQINILSCPSSHRNRWPKCQLI